MTASCQDDDYDGNDDDDDDDDDDDLRHDAGGFSLKDPNKKTTSMRPESIGVGPSQDHFATDCGYLCHDQIRCSSTVQGAQQIPLPGGLQTGTQISETCAGVMSIAPGHPQTSADTLLLDVYWSYMLPLFYLSPNPDEFRLGSPFSNQTGN